MATVKIASGKAAKVGTRSKVGKYEYEVQADGSVKNLTTGRTTGKATGKAPAKAPAKAVTRSAAPKAEKTAPAPAKMSAATATARKMGSTPAKETGITVGGRGSGAATPITKGGRGSGYDTTLRARAPAGPQGRGGKRGTVESPSIRPIGFDTTKYDGGFLKDLFGKKN